MLEAPSQTPPQPAKKCREQFRYWGPRALVVSVVLTVGLVGYFRRDIMRSFIRQLVLWIEENPVSSPFIISTACFLLVVFMMPYSPVASLAGYVLIKTYSRWITAMTIAISAAYFGAYAGAVVNFFTGRYLCRA